MKQLEVTFFPDKSDSGLNCYEMVLKMILKYFIPNNEYNLEELEKITQKKEDQFSYSSSSYIFLLNLGFEIKTISMFDTDKFIANGRVYLKEYLGTVLYDIQDASGDIDNGIAMLKDFKETIKKNLDFKRNYVSVTSSPKIDDIKSLIDDGFLIDCTIYEAHSVLVFGYTDLDVIYHDPAEASGSCYRSFESFCRIWIIKDITAFRMQRN